MAKRVIFLVSVICLYLGFAVVDVESSMARPFGALKPMTGSGLSLHPYLNSFPCQIEFAVGFLRMTLGTDAWSLR